MRKLSLFFAIACCFGVSYSQDVRFADRETSNNKIKWGVKLGVIFSNPSVQYPIDTLYNSASKTTSRTSIMVGFFVRTPLNQKVLLQPEILMVSKGLTGFDGVGKSFTYLEFPINLLYRSKGFLIGGGPALAYQIGRHYYYYNYAVGGSFRKFDLGINLLAAYESTIGFSINLHYTYGLLNASNDKVTIPVLKNRCFGITAGYVF